MTNFSLLADPDISLHDAYLQCSKAIENGLFTAMRFHPRTMEVERLYSTLPDAYPVSGRKPKRQTEWGDKVLLRQEVNCGYGAADLAWAFDDHKKILELGLKAVLNVPVVAEGRVQGTINYLRAGPAFTEQEQAVGCACAKALAQRVEMQQLCGGTHFDVSP